MKITIYIKYTFFPLEKLKHLIDEQKSQNSLLSTELTKMSELCDKKALEVSQFKVQMKENEINFEEQKLKLQTELTSQKEKYLNQINQSQENIIQLSRLREKNEADWTSII